jgi:hypothetical protein
LAAAAEAAAGDVALVAVAGDEALAEGALVAEAVPAVGSAVEEVLVVLHAAVAA